MSEEKIMKSDYLVNKIYNKSKNIFDKNNITDINDIQSIISNVSNIIDDYSRNLWRIYNDLTDKEPKLFTLLTPELFLMIVQHLRTIASQKIESRHVGVKIIIFSEDPRDSYIGFTVQAQRIKLQEIMLGEKIEQHFKDFTHKMQRTYKCVDSSIAFFAYTYNLENNSLTYNGIKKLDRQNNSMEAICDEEKVGFELIDGFIRIFFNNTVIMDYFLSETGGNWLPRYTVDIIKIFQDELNFTNKRDYSLLAKVVMQLSRMGKGAMLIITSTPESISTNYSIPCSQSVESLEKAAENGTIYSFASYDGAVVLNNQHTSRLKVCNFGVILSPKSNIGNNDDYYFLLQYSNSGSRHEKAVRHAYDNPDDCIIVISENRSVSILKGKKPILWRDTKVDKAMLDKLRNEEEL